MGLQVKEKILQVEESVSWPFKKMYTSSAKMDITLNSETNK